MEPLHGQRVPGVDVPLEPELGLANQLWIDFTDELRERPKRDQHNVVGIQGPPGAGKSELGLHIGEEVQPGFPLANVFYSQPSAVRGISTTQKRQVYLLDEGGNVAMNRNWNNRTQIVLMQLLNVIRQMQHTLIWCMPNLDRADIIVRDDLLTHKIHALRIGRAVIQRRVVYFNQRENQLTRTWKTIINPLRDFPSYAVTHPERHTLYIKNKANAAQRQHHGAKRMLEESELNRVEREIQDLDVT